MIDNSGIPEQLAWAMDIFKVSTWPGEHGKIPSIITLAIIMSDRALISGPSGHDIDIAEETHFRAAAIS